MKFAKNRLNKFYNPKLYKAPPKKVTEQRKEENEDFKDLMASDTAAKEIMKFAKNRLNKFYNPKLYKAPPKKELSKEDRIVENMSGSAALFAQISQHSHQEAPPPPPESF